MPYRAYLKFVGHGRPLEAIAAVIPTDARVAGCPTSCSTELPWSRQLLQMLPKTMPDDAIDLRSMPPVGHG